MNNMCLINNEKELREKFKNNYEDSTFYDYELPTSYPVIAYWPDEGFSMEYNDEGIQVFLVEKKDWEEMTRQFFPNSAQDIFDMAEQENT